MNSVSNLRVLIVDDAANLRRIVRSLLTELGCEQLREAEDGAVALRLLKTRTCDVVLSDINMPNVNGFELLKAIKSDTRLLHVQVWLMMAEATREDIVMAAENGAAGYLIKPFGKATLRAKLGQSQPTCLA